MAPAIPSRSLARPADGTDLCNFGMYSPFKHFGVTYRYREMSDDVEFTVMAAAAVGRYVAIGFSRNTLMVSWEKNVCERMFGR